MKLILIALLVILSISFATAQKDESKGESYKEIQDYLADMQDKNNETHQNIKKNIESINDKTKQIEELLKKRWARNDVMSRCEKSETHLKATAGLCDNILPLGVYPLLSRMDHGEKMNLSTLLGLANKGESERITQYFKNKPSVTREDIRLYVRNSYNHYAAKIISGKSAEEVLEMSKSEMDHWLKYTTAAMYGALSRKGKQLVFAPYWEDVRVVFKSFGRPPLTDEAYQKHIDYRRTYGDYIPNLKFIYSRMSKEDEQLLFKQTKHITKYAENVRYDSLDKVKKDAFLMLVLSEMRPDLYLNPIYIKVVSGYYEDLLTGLTLHRLGQPTLDERDLIAIDKNGKTSWSEDSFNGTYGGPDVNQIMQDYIFANRFELVRTYGIKAASIFYIGNPEKYNYNQTLTYKQAIAYLQSVNPKTAKRFAKQVRSGGYTSTYHKFRVFKEEYDALRSTMLTNMIGGI